MHVPAGLTKCDIGLLQAAIEKCASVSSDNNVLHLVIRKEITCVNAIRDFL